MGTHYSPRTVTDGLVFAFDTGNNKSYKGAPTTNLAPYISTHGTSDFTLPSLPEGVSTVHSKGAIINGTTDWADIFNTSGYSIPAGERLVISAWVYIPADKVNNRFNINANINGNNTGLASWHDLAAGQWHKLRGSWLNNTGTTANTTYTRLEPWTPAEWTGGTNTAYAINFMVESGPFGADYMGSQALPANTTRSVTQGLLDQTKNSTLDLTNVSFDADAQMTFDGTDDYVVAAHASGQEPLNNVTFESIVKLTSTSHYKGMFMKSNYGNSNGYIAVHTTGNGYMRLECSDTLGSTRALDTASVGTNTRFTPNETVHFALTYDGLNIRTYINGILKDTYAWSYGLGNNQGNLELGRFWASSWAGDIYAFKQYNRALSAAEVQQNYNAIKGRFGL